MRYMWVVRGTLPIQGRRLKNLLAVMKNDYDLSSVSDVKSSELVPKKIVSPYKSEGMLLNRDEEVEQMVR